MLVDARLQKLDLSAEAIRHWANRRCGVGFDQMIVLDDAPHSDYLASYRFYNADGSEAEQCGNGQRCIGRYLWESGWAKRRRFQVTGPGGPVAITVHSASDVEVALPAPTCRLMALNQDSRDVRAEWAEVSVGNPHRVFWVNSQAELDDCHLAAQAAAVQADYPRGVNLEVVHMEAADHLRIRIYERGVGETQACGSGAAAAAVATVERQLAMRSGNGHKPIRVDMPGGRLLVDYQRDSGRLTLRGPAAHVYQGRVFYP